MTTDSIPIADVIVGKRIRADLGDLTELKKSLSRVGLLQPIVLAPDNHLLCGQRRYQAARELGWPTIRFVRADSRHDAITLLIAERDENTCRKPMTAEELADVGRQLEALESVAAHGRMVDGARRGGQARVSPAGDTLPEPADGRTDSVVGAALGMSNSQYYRLKTVTRMARGEGGGITTAEQEQARDLLDRVNAGKLTITGAFEALKPPTERKRPAKPGPSRNHRKIIWSIAMALDAYATVLADISELDGSLSAAEAGEYLPHLDGFVKPLNRLRKQVKELTQS